MSLITVGPSRRVEGWLLHKCEQCGNEIDSPYSSDGLHCYCETWTPPPNAGLSDAEIKELFPGDDPTLIGNRIAALTKAIGIPPCAACDHRRIWINSAHEIIRSAQWQAFGSELQSSPERG